ncbi:hypothetical protein ZIOFF_014478 [Zingiber officinale]|uniref:Uncharacterized protein n=1 Tax=Zingiber officinale TaxID=94328 RepID=A0A8J5LS07_ZINOF|nr:hypothetical protein ZIOFF_014478 [Zingiber officinale]
MFFLLNIVHGLGKIIMTSLLCFKSILKTQLLCEAPPVLHGKSLQQERVCGPPHASPCSSVSQLDKHKPLQKRLRLFPIARIIYCCTPLSAVIVFNTYVTRSNENQKDNREPKEYARSGNTQEQHGQWCVV